MDIRPPRSYYSPIMTSQRVQRQIDRLLDEAEAAFAQRDWLAVRERAQDALTLEPENQDALTFLTAAERALEANTRSGPPIPQTETTPAEQTPQVVNTHEAERRQLTVMFCDLQGSTALSQQLDPEDLREVIRGYQEVCAGAVSRFEGHIAKYLGDGLLIYFGYPQAHEDDPQRAVRGGLAILEDMEALNTRLKADKDIELAVRIGVHTGLVVAGEMGGGDTIETLAIVGETPNIAARLQEAASPNSVVVSDVTANLVQGFFVHKALGFHELKGISEPMELFAVLSESGAQTRFEVAAASQLTPLVGREQELGLLLDRWEQAQEGLGQVVLLGGEPGIGKSRLIDALTERIANEPHALRGLRCSAYHQNSALHPVLEYLEAWLGFGRDDSAEERLTMLESALAHVDFPLAEAVPLLSGLLSVPLAERYPALAMDPEVQRDRTRQLLVALLLDSAGDQPVFLVLEDLHWADPSTLAVLDLLLEQVPTARVLALFSFRSEFTPPWPSRGHVTQIMLNRLTRRLAGEMVGRLTGGKTLPEEVLSQVAAKSDGVPIFVEELTRMLLESGLLKEAGDHYELTGPLTTLAIPSTLQDSLTARLDRLTSAREVAQLGAVLGREFTYDLIRSVSPMDEELLGSHLQRLVDAEFLYQRGLPPDANYTFKHALIQDAAYQSLLHSRRQQYHQRTAQVLEEGSAGIVEMQPELLAHHFAQAGLTERAVIYWLRAGERAMVTYAYEEALGHFERGLIARDIALSGTEAAPDEEAAALLFGLGRAQAPTLPRYRTHEAVTSLARALDYYAEAGESDRAVAIAEYPFYPMIGHRIGNDQLIARALTLVDPDSPRAGRLLSRYGRLLGLEEGDYAGAQEAFEKALAISRRESDPVLEMRVLADAANVDLIHLRFQESLDKSMRTIELAGRADDPYPQVLARYTAVLDNLHLGQLEEARLQASAVLAPAEGLRDRFWHSMALRANQDAAQMAGQFGAARELSDRALAASPTESRALCARAMLECETGDFVQGEAFLDRLVEVMRLTPPGPTMENGMTAMAVATAARICGKPDRLDLAQVAAQPVISFADAVPFVEAMARLGMGLQSVERGDKSAAKEQYLALERWQGVMWLFANLAVDRVLGLLSHTMGNLDQAEAHFDDALAFCRKAGFRPELAWSCCDYADMLLERNNDGDQAKAMSLMDDSLSISRELGMRPLMERVLSRREILKA
ncbi:MAG: AAA family ATPase [Chloroflexi bacterium]|nr:AAA family ATPase [Chloroflexota bacterium]